VRPSCNRKAFATDRLACVRIRCLLWALVHRR
jgi:hypothetical protein